MAEMAIFIGGFIRWLFKGCKTNLRDELEGNLEATWGRTYDFENYIIGFVSACVILGVAFLIAFG